jgi:hypothetical protein
MRNRRQLRRATPDGRWTLARRNGSPTTARSAFADELYRHVALSTTRISLLTGHSAQQTSWNRGASTARRPARTMLLQR